MSAKMFAAPSLDEVRDRLAPRISCLGSVRSFEIGHLQDGGLVVSLHPINKTILLDQLPEIVKIIEVYANIKKVQVGTDPMIDVDLVRAFSDSARIETPNSFREAFRQLAHLCQALFDDISENRSLFLVSQAGVYLDVALQKTADPPMPSEQMIGKTLDEVIGESASSAILRAGKDSKAAKKFVEVSYTAPINGEQRSYRAKVCHCQELLLVIVSRTQ